jgi:hypothetical protein
MAKLVDQLFVVEYSVSQDKTRVTSLDGMLKKNLRRIVENEVSTSDYVPVAVFLTRSRAEMFSIEFPRVLDTEIVSNSYRWRHISEALGEVEGWLGI